MNPIKLIQKYYDKDSDTYYWLVEHSKLVTKKALKIAKFVPQLKPDLQFIEEAGMLHDIGIFLTNDPPLKCTGKEHYICHGVLGAELLRKEGFPKHARVCETHMGFTVKEIKDRNLPLPHKNMFPETIEEKIISFADKFYSKNTENLFYERSIPEIKKLLKTFSQKQLDDFEEMIKLFNYHEN